MKQILFLFLTVTIVADAQLVTANTANGTASNTTTMLVNTTRSLVVNQLIANLTLLQAANLTSPALNGTRNLSLLNSTMTSGLNTTHVGGTSSQTNQFARVALLNETQSTFNTTSGHVNVTSINAINDSSSALNRNVTLNSANETIITTTNLTLLQPVNVSFTENVVGLNRTNIVLLNITVPIVNGTSFSASNQKLNNEENIATNLTSLSSLNINRSVGFNQTVLLNNTKFKINNNQLLLTNVTAVAKNKTTGIVDVLNQTISSLENAAANTYHLIKLVSFEILWIQQNLPVKFNSLLLSINKTSRHIHELFFQSQPNFTVYCIADLQSFGSKVETLVAGVGQNISGLYEEALNLVSHQIMTTTTTIADAATNISLILKNGTTNNRIYAEICANRINPEVLAFSDNYINLVGACSTDQEPRIKSIAVNTMSTSESLFSQVSSIVNKINRCMELPTVNLHESQTCVSDVCSQLSLAVLNIEMEASLVQAGVSFDISSLKDRVTYCSLMRSVEATNKANVLMEMTTLCLAGNLK